MAARDQREARGQFEIGADGIGGGDECQRLGAQHGMPAKGIGQETAPPSQMDRIQTGQRVVEQQEPGFQGEAAAQRDPARPRTTQ